MRLIYISHPYGGKKENIEDAERVRRELQKADPENAYINPLTMFQGEEVAEKVLLKRAISVMIRCDAVYFCKDWGASVGCNAERYCADSYDMEMIFEEDEE